MKETAIKQEPKWVDTHCHLQLTDYDLLSLNYENIEYLILPGVDAESSKKAKDISSKLPVPAYWAAGLHPHDAKNLTAQKDELLKLIAEADLIGETGLDYYRDHSSREEQRENLTFHLERAKEFRKPIIIHCRDSFSDTYDLIKNYADDFPVILHSWTGGNKWTKKFIELGVYFSLSGILTYETAKDLKLSVKQIPTNRLLVETDTPYLAPGQYKGQNNKPEFIVETAKKLAELKEMTLQDLSSITISNTNTILSR